MRRAVRPELNPSTQDTRLLKYIDSGSNASDNGPLFTLAKTFFGREKRHMTHASCQAESTSVADARRRHDRVDGGSHGQGVEAFITVPNKTALGCTMKFQGIANAQEGTCLIEFLSMATQEHKARSVCWAARCRRRHQPPLS
jgi:hypothetical protein